MAFVPDSARAQYLDVVQGWAPPIRFGRKGAAEYVPTWQVGRPVDTGYDFSRYADEGYRSSIVFACISERATSLADLPIELLQRAPDGFEPVESPVLELLRAPSGEMDGFEFLEALVTHLDVAGNAYIEKVRKSTDPQRRNAYAVKELGLIRPDYVNIVPGGSRDKDVFEVTVQGRVIKRLPRRDVIHVRTPNPANDFYGLSPLAVISREVDIDRLMTDFDLSFFRNAGVPMGILKTKQNHSPDELQQMKGAFKRSFNGLRRWFEVLILNSENAEYQPLGGMPNQMEQTETRYYAESRVCMAYGVPPILVGAGVGLARATYSNYEQAQFSFWSETMLPLSKRIAAALTRELLPEFATAQTRGAFLAFDTSGVKALQEDNTARYDGAQALIAGGGFTVNEALAAHGLPQVEGGDFYVRSLTQVIDVALPTASRQRVDVIAAPVQAGRTITQRKDLRAARNGMEQRYVRDLRDFFEGQVERVIDRLGGKDAEELVPVTEDRLLEEVVDPHNVAAMEVGWALASEELGITDEFSPADPLVRDILATAGQNVRGINEETRRQLVKALQVARDEGLSVPQLANLIRRLPAFSPSRAETVARTELAYADNQGAAARYEASGLVDEVDLIDGPDCGLRSHDDPEKAQGLRVSLATFKEHPIAHPNCVRSRSPVIRGA